MRCLTLAESLVSRGHRVALMGAFETVPWLAHRLDEATQADDLELIECAADTLDLGVISSWGPDWLVVDSYWIMADDVSRADALVPCLAIVDGDDRNITASIYLDQNLGSENLPWRSQTRDRMLAGSSYSLIRNEILRQREPSPEVVRHNPPHVVAFMGGSDPRGIITDVVSAIIQSELKIELTAVCASGTRAAVSNLAAPHSWITAIETTSDLPGLLGDADAVVSACGTSAWELCTLGIPSLFVAVVENQRQARENAVRAGVALGIDAVDESILAHGEVGRAVQRLIEDSQLRQSLTARCRETFDGAGKERVVRAMESWSS